MTAYPALAARIDQELADRVWRNSADGMRATIARPTTARRLKPRGGRRSHGDMVDQHFCARP